jgi:hypothetical protein
VKWSESQLSENRPFVGRGNLDTEIVIDNISIVNYILMRIQDLDTASGIPALRLLAIFWSVRLRAFNLMESGVSAAGRKQQVL